LKLEAKAFLRALAACALGLLRQAIQCARRSVPGNRAAEPPPQPWQAVAGNRKSAIGALEWGAIERLLCGFRKVNP